MVKFAILLGLGAWAFLTLKGTLMSTKDEVLAAIAAVGTQLGKAKTEILTKITDLETQIGNGADMDDVLAALGELKTSAQALDDIVPDPATPAG